MKAKSCEANEFCALANGRLLLQMVVVEQKNSWPILMTLLTIQWLGGSYGGARGIHIPHIFPNRGASWSYVEFPNHLIGLYINTFHWRLNIINRCISSQPGKSRTGGFASSNSAMGCSLGSAVECPKGQTVVKWHLPTGETDEVPGGVGCFCSCTCRVYLRFV